MVQNANLLQAFLLILYLFVYENKYYLQLYSDKCAYKVANKQLILIITFLIPMKFSFLICDEWLLKILHYKRIDITKRIDPAKCNNCKQCIVCQYCFFNYGFTNNNSVCNSCYDLTVLLLNLSSAAIIIVKGVDYSCIIHDISKSDAIHLLENSVLGHHGYI